MSSNSTSTLTELTGAIAQPVAEAVIEQTPEPGWKFWLQTAILALSAYGTLTLIGYLKRPDEAEAAAKPAVGKKKPAATGKASAGTPSRGSAQHQHQHNANLAAVNSAAGGKPQEAMMRILQQVQEFSEMGRHEEAEKLVLTMMELVEREIQSNPTAFIDMLRLQRQLAEVYRKWGKYPQGIEVLEQIVEQLSQLGAPPSEMAGVYGDISSYYLESGDFDKAEQTGAATIKMIEQVEGPNSPNLFGICYSMALTMKKKQKLTEARSYCTRAINALKKSDTPAAQMQLLIVQMNMEIAEILLDERKFDEAEELYKAVVESMLNSPFRERSYFAIQEIARNYFRVRQYEKAEQYLKKAMDSLPDIPTEAKHELQSDLTILYSEIGKQEEADRLITELKLRAIEAPLAQSRYFKTTEALIKDNRYHLKLALKELPEDHLPPDAVIEASFDAIPNKAEAFTFRHHLDEESFKNKSILITSHPDTAAGLAEEHRVVTLRVFPNATATEPIGIHKQIIKSTGGLSNLLFPWLNVSKPEEEIPVIPAPTVTVSEVTEEEEAKTEEKAEEITEDKVEEKTEEKTEEKVEEPAVEVKTEEKVEEPVAETEKVEEKTEEKAEEKVEEKAEETTTEQTEEEVKQSETTSEEEITPAATSEQPAVNDKDVFQSSLDDANPE